MTKVIQNVRMQILKSRSSFLKQNLQLFKAFIDNDCIESRIVPHIWSDLQSMTCKHICPWCGVPCCGSKTCNDLFEPEQPPSNQQATLHHSCQFHRDTTITGTHVVINYIDESQPGEISDTLPNFGGCPEHVSDEKIFVLVYIVIIAKHSSI